MSFKVLSLFFLLPKKLISPTMGNSSRTILKKTPSLVSFSKKNCIFENLLRFHNLSIALLISSPFTRVIPGESLA